jgi:hypothetical protein
MTVSQQTDSRLQGFGWGLVWCCRW